jgi:hypothetical protein
MKYPLMCLCFHVKLCFHVYATLSQWHGLRDVGKHSYLSLLNIHVGTCIQHT